MSRNDLARRAIVWLRRYGPAELAGTAAALLAAGLAHAATDSIAAAAFAATWAEFCCYYGLHLWRALPAGRRTSSRAVLVALRNLLLEFGPAELLDTLFLRPTALYAALALVPWLALGALLGKLVADVCFYAQAIIAYELRLHLLPDTDPPAGTAD